MKALTSKLRVRAWGNKQDFKVTQELTRVYYLWGIRIWTKVLDKEEVPQYAVISNACFGDLSGWYSKFAPFGPGGWKTT